MNVKAGVYVYLVSEYQSHVVRALAKTGVRWELYWWERARAYPLERAGGFDSRQGLL